MEGTWSWETQPSLPTAGSLPQHPQAPSSVAFRQLNCSVAVEFRPAGSCLRLLPPRAFVWGGVLERGWGYWNKREVYKFTAVRAPVASSIGISMACFIQVPLAAESADQGLSFGKWPRRPVPPSE